MKTKDNAKAVTNAAYHRSYFDWGRKEYAGSPQRIRRDSHDGGRTRKVLRGNMEKAQS